MLHFQGKGILLLQNLSKCISSTATGHLSLNHVISCIQISGRLLLTDPTTITNGQVTPSLNGLCWKSHNSAFGSLDDIWWRHNQFLGRGMTFCRDIIISRTLRTPLGPIRQTQPMSLPTPIIGALFLCLYRTLLSLVIDKVDLGRLRQNVIFNIVSKEM